MESINLVCNFILDWASIILFFAGIIFGSFAFYGTTGLFSRSQNTAFSFIAMICIALSLVLALINRSMPAQTIAIIILAIVIAYLSWKNTHNEKVPHWRGGLFLEMEDGTLISPKKADESTCGDSGFSLDSKSIIVGFLLPGASAMMMPRIRFLEEVTENYKQAGVYWEQTEGGVKVYFPQPLKINDAEKYRQWCLQLESPFPFHGERNSCDADTHFVSYKILIR